MKLTQLAALVLLPVLSAPAFAESDAGTLSNPNLPPAQFLAQERKGNLNMVTGNPNNRSAEVFYGIGSLATGESATHTVSLRANRSYGIYTDCAPSSCKDVDMELLHNGRVVREDHMDDTYPLFHITPSRSGTYTIRVKMAQCKPGYASCAYHTQVIKKD